MRKPAENALLKSPMAAIGSPIFNLKKKKKTTHPKGSLTVLCSVALQIWWFKFPLMSKHHSPSCWKTTLQPTASCRRPFGKASASLAKANGDLLKPLGTSSVTGGDRKS